MVSKKTLVKYLKENAIHANFSDRLKMTYRPFICPFSQLLNYVRENEKVADIGCGSGQFCLLLAQFTRPRAIYGYEIHESLINNANKLFENKSNLEYHFEIFNGIDLPDSIQNADVVFLIDVLHHVSQKKVRLFFSVIYDKMKRGGRLILKDINAASPFVYFNKLHDLLFSGEVGHEMAMDQAIDMLQEMNYKILHTEKKQMYVYPHYIIVAEK